MLDYVRFAQHLSFNSSCTYYISDSWVLLDPDPYRKQDPCVVSVVTSLRQTGPLEAQSPSAGLRWTSHCRVTGAAINVLNLGLASDSSGKAPQHASVKQNVSNVSLF